MKVLMIHTTYQYKGGEDTVVDEEMKLLKANGTDAELLQFNNDGNALIKVLQMPFNITAYKAVRSKIKAFRPDVVHVHNFHFAASASVLYAIKKSGVPFVITLHNFRLLCPSATLFYKGNLFLDSLHQKFPWSAVSKGVYKNSMLLTFWLSFSMYLHKKINTWKMCDQFIVLTDHAKNIFLNSDFGLSKDKITVKPNFCEAPLPHIHARENYFLFIGRLTEEKGIRLLLNVFSSSTYTIKIAGDGPLKNEVLQYSAKHENIEYLGSLSKDKVQHFLGNCSALIFPSVWYEGMPLTIIEAFATGTAVIASKLGAMETMITYEVNGLHFEKGNEKDLAGQLEKWQSMNQKQKEIYSVNAYKTYDQLYSPKKNINQLLSIYQLVYKKKTNKIHLDKTAKATYLQY